MPYIYIYIHIHCSINAKQNRTHVFKYFKQEMCLKMYLCHAATTYSIGSYTYIYIISSQILFIFRIYFVSFCLLSLVYILCFSTYHRLNYFILTRLLHYYYIFMYVYFVFIWTLSGIIHISFVIIHTDIYIVSLSIIIALKIIFITSLSELILMSYESDKIFHESTLIITVVQKNFYVSMQV